MKLSHVSVLREYGVKDREVGYFVRAELECHPTAAWFKQFYKMWLSTPVYCKYAIEPILNRNEIIIPIQDGDSVCETVEAIKNIISGTRAQLNQEPKPNRIHEAII